MTILKIFQNLEGLIESCSSDNWDGYDAKAIDFDSYTEATRFAQALTKNNSPSLILQSNPMVKSLFRMVQTTKALFFR